MAKYQVILTKNTIKNLETLDRIIFQRIKQRLEYFRKGKPLSQAIQLTKPADAQYRWRLGDYRILFDYRKSDQTIIILKIQHRKEIYR